MYRSTLSANIFRRMVESQSRGHDGTTCSGVAKALQHSDDTALRYYQAPDAGEGCRRQKFIEVVDSTANFEYMVLEE